MTLRSAIVSAVLIAACSPATSRPAFAPMPEARRGELELEVPAATERLAAALTGAGIPVARVSTRDGYVESRWFEAASGRPVRGRPLGMDRVRVRGWVTPSRHGYSEVVVETVYRPFADPSKTPRELEQSVPYAHPTRARIRDLFDTLGAGVAVDEPDAVAVAVQRPPVPSGAPAPSKTPMDSARAETPVRPDTVAAQAAARADTTRARAPAPVTRDTTRPLVTPPQPVPIQRDRPVLTEQPATGFSVQVAATSERAVADTAAARLRELGYRARIVSEGTLLKVRTTRFASRNAAMGAQRRLRPTFPDAFLTER